MATKQWITTSEHREAEEAEALLQLLFAAAAVLVADVVETGGMVHFRQVGQLVVYHEVAQLLREEYQPWAECYDAARGA